MCCRAGTATTRSSAARGKDTLTGGIGSDQFDYVAIGDSVVGADADQITDFSRAQATRST